MQKQRRIRATSPAKWIVCTGLLILMFLLYSSGIVTIEAKNAIPVAIIVIPCLLMTIWQCIHSFFLTEKGIECCRLGRVIRMLSWDQVAQINMAREFSNSSNRILVITPVGCAVYDSKQWYGWQYASRFRGQVIVIDNTKKNRDFIETYFGEIIIDCNTVG